MVPNKNDYKKNIAEKGGKGKIDLVGIDGTYDIDGNQVTQNNVLIVEYKIPESRESLLRAVLEIITYFCQLGDKKEVFKREAYAKFISCYQDKYESLKKLKVEDFLNAEVQPAILGNVRSYLNAHPYVYKLIREYNVKCFVFKEESNDTYYDFRKMSQTELSEFEENSKEKFEAIEDVRWHLDI